ncbi:hypothetical protein [Acinetobacter baylyi]|uniref:hypothetical protein n=1 Tax=Acinetobacter baylyi TaxID=202950 RepID=UPI0031E44E85
MYLNAKTIADLVNNETATGKLIQAQKAGGKWVTSNFAVIEAIAQLAAVDTEADSEQLEQQVSDYLYTYYVDVRDLPSVGKLAPSVIQSTQQGLSLSESLHQACAEYYEVALFDLDTAPELEEDPIIETEDTVDVDAETVATEDATPESAQVEQVPESDQDKSI